tara:strand:+ start:202 stop:453 length:252 start_codon:yes stop_codon:yes gene_type:complete
MTTENFTEEDIEHYQQNSNSTTLQVVYIFWSIVSLMAIYYSFVIYKGFNLGGFLLAILFSPVYLLWGFYKVGFPPTNKRRRKK